MDAAPDSARGGGNAALAPAEHRTTRPSMRAVLAVFSVLTALAVLSLYVRPTETDRFFAWTIAPPLTAAFLGAGYLAGCVLVVLSLRERAWAHSRIPVLTILVFTWLTLGATLLHLPALHFDDAPPVAGFAAWFWMAVYVVVPVAMLPMIVRQERAQGADPPARRPVPVLLKAPLAVQSALMLVVGGVLYVAPGSSDEVWPWTLTAFTSRAIGAWLIAFGIATALAAVAGDLERLRTAAVAYAVFGVATLVAVLRFAGTVSWDRPVAWALTAMLVSIAVTGAAGAWTARNHAAGPPGRPSRAA